WKTAIVFGDDENELFGSRDHVLDRLEGRASLSVEVGGDDVRREVGQGEDMRRMPLLLQYPAINMSKDIGVVWGSVGAGYNGDHQCVLFVKFNSFVKLFIYILRFGKDKHTPEFKE